MLLLLPIMDCCTKKRLLTSMTSICACAAFGLLSIAVATDYWLFTSERKKEVASGVNNTMGPIYILVHSGLWHRCEYKDESKDSSTCIYIKYFTGDDDREGLGPTQAILLNIRRATVFPLVSLMVLLIAGIMCFLGHCHPTRKVLTFAAGILFVLAGLCTLVGIILYIGSITEEVGNKPRASIEKPKFSYYYGYSFMMAVGSFVLMELSGVFAVYLYITRHKQAQRKKMQALKAQQNDRGPSTWRYRKPTRDPDHYHHYPHYTPHHHDCPPSRPASRERSQSRDRSRDPSASRSETYFTYTPVSDMSHELSNYTFQRDNTDNTISTTAEMHAPRTANETNYIGATAPSIDIVRRTTPV